MRHRISTGRSRKGEHIVNRRLFGTKASCPSRVINWRMLAYECVRLRVTQRGAGCGENVSHISKRNAHPAVHPDCLATEVRALAHRSSDAAREINDLIAKSGTQVKSGVDLVGRTGTALRQIVDSVSEISHLVSDIAASSSQQSNNLAEINQAVTQLDQSTQQNAARLEETTAASEALRKDAVGLVETVSHFRVNADARESAGVVTSRPRAEARQTGRAQPSQPAEPPKRAAKPAAVRKPAGGPAVAVEKSISEWEDF